MAKIWFGQGRSVSEWWTLVSSLLFSCEFIGVDIIILWRKFSCSFLRIRIWASGVKLNSTICWKKTLSIRNMVMVNGIHWGQICSDVWVGIVVEQSECCCSSCSQEALRIKEAFWQGIMAWGATLFWNLGSYLWWASHTSHVSRLYSWAAIKTEWLSIQEQLNHSCWCH